MKCFVEPTGSDRISFRLVLPILVAILAAPSNHQAEGLAAPPDADANGKKTASLDVSRYTVDVEARKIRGVFGNASGLTFRPESRSLFLVINSPTRMVEIDLQGTVKRSIRLAGFEDTEGVAYLGQDRFGILDERRRHLCVVHVEKTARTIRFGDLKRIENTAPPEQGGWYLVVDPKPTPNVGLEGLSFDKENRRFFIVKEKNPRKFFHVTLGPDPDSVPMITEPWKKSRLKSLRQKDLSGVHFHSATRQLLVMSHESRNIVQCSLDGRPVSRLSLDVGSAGLKRAIPQAEGITMDDRQVLYVLSEPNLFYVFKPPPTEPNK